MSAHPKFCPRCSIGRIRRKRLPYVMVVEDQLVNIPRFRFLQYWGTYRGYRDPAQPSSQLKRVFYYPPDSLEPRPAPPGRHKARNKSA